jgi:serine/threonine-protein kinase
VATGLAVTLDFVGLFSGHSLLGGIHTISLGIDGCVVTQALLLSRSHVARQRELERSAEELRRQVVERSRELSVALAELAKRPPEVLGEDRVIADRYRIVRRLGAGGMGTVYEVRRTSDDQRLALKTLRGRADPELMQRFAREAEIAAELHHDNLVPVLDVGIADGSLYLVMPLIEGGSLEQQRAKFGDAAFARPILAQIAAGLAALHARGIVHRDLKPANVLLAPHARIADFGLAAFDPTSLTLASGSFELADTAAPAAPLTRAGDIFGTPRYMAPELAGGAAAFSPAADLFAFGVLAFEMLANRQPFVEPVVMTRLENREPSSPSVDLLPADLRSLVGSCLALDPASRPPATDLVAALRPR